jgi:hypothetical protein
MTNALKKEWPLSSNWSESAKELRKMAAELKIHQQMCEILCVASDLEDHPEVRGVKFGGEHESNDQGGSSFYMSLSFKLEMNASEDELELRSGNWQWCEECEAPDECMEELGESFKNEFYNMAEELDGTVIEFDGKMNFIEKMAVRLLGDQVGGAWSASLVAIELEQVVLAGVEAGKRPAL